MLVYATNQPRKTPSDDDLLTVMTYNIRFAADDAEHLWSERFPLVLNVIERNRPDVLGVQEPLHEQMRDLADGLGEYDSIGEGRDGGTAGEYSAIFFRRRRLEVREHGAFWLSDTPEIPGSITWGNSLPRMVTWGAFHDRATGGDFVMFNTHFDYDPTNHGARVRLKSARLLERRAAGAMDPVIVTGDFNDAAGTAPAYEHLTTAGFADTWHEAERVGPLVTTFHDYGTADSDIRIDWILRKGQVRTATATIDHGEGARRASDHFPVVARVQIEN